MRPGAGSPQGGRAVVVACLLALSACTTGAPSDAIVFASGADLESANPLVTVHPLARQVQRHVLLVTLTRLDSTLSPVPYFARRWEWSADQRVLTLHLHPGLAWHDGVPTTARDVVFTFAAAKDPATGFPRAAEVAGIESLDAVDDSTLVIRYAVPQPELPLILSELPIVPEHLLRDVPRDAYRRHAYALDPVGNGPYRFVRRDAGRRWIFHRSPSFPADLGGPPATARLVVAVVDEATTKFAGLASGDLHVAGIAPSMATLVDADPALEVVSYPVAFSTSIVFNTHRAPFDDVRVRLAVDALLNRQRIIDVALAGFGVPAAGPVTDSHPFAAAPPRLTSAQADSLLTAAGWPLVNGVRRRGDDALGFTLLSVGSGDNAIEQLIQADLRTAGIAMEIRQMELGAFLAIARRSPKEFDALYTGVGGDLALSHLVSMFDSRLAGGALDYAGFHTPSLDALFHDAASAPSIAARGDAWRRIQAELAREVPVSWIYHARGVQGVSRRLRGVRMDLRGEMATLATWRLDAGPGAP